jgi:outer membrane protein assembly factor BamA
MFANAELRFPLIEAALTPIGVIGGIRGVFFFGIGGAWFKNQPSPDTGCPAGTFTFATSNTEVCKPVIDGFVNANNQTQLVYGPARPISGFRLKDGRASYGLGLETFALGFPIHFDWSWRTTFNKSWEDVVFASEGGSTAWRKPRFAVWIGYDF